MAAATLSSGAGSGAERAPRQATGRAGRATLLTAGDLQYQGAFAYPAGDDWAYSGHALAFYPQGDPTGPADGFPGSLYASAHDWYDLVGEMTIPAPQFSASFEALPTATVLRERVDITGGLLATTCAACETCDCGQWEVDGLEVLDGSQRVVWVLRDWYNVGGENLDSTGWSELDMTGSQGVWHIGPRPDGVFHSAKTADYLFKAPGAFASQHLEGKWLISGNHRLSGSPGGAQGPSLYAMAPWEHGNPPPAGAQLDALALVYYPWVLACTENDFDQCHFPGYRVDDDWGGGAWIDTGQLTGILIAGRKGLGDNCYGIPGDTCPPSLCSADYGWHSDPYEPQILFYDPAEIAEVTAGVREPWQVLPYEVYQPLSEVFDPDCGRLDAVAYDSQHHLVYVTEREAGPWGETAVHVYQVRTVLFEDDFETGNTSAWSATVGGA